MNGKKQRARNPYADVKYLSSVIFILKKYIDIMTRRCDVMNSSMIPNV